ncbi:two-component regulator propeller domain-containing protein [Marivirga salinae]|uniref:Two-component regulator propeller domain-containing protein n=1 Tax=Marivirga salinarum TaxID=3059078 RepID=A0AA51RDL7_9BACT|nr:two-component regulator propeller domain-containing protein [Marivirga sp. BDSF4-3]WMN10649.1 two-component regulator propeller domain-containing protein [Marivirga sp. BDSF4-3]
MRFLYLLIVQLLAIPLWAQNQLKNTDFNNLNVSDGLSQNIVETIYQGKSGFLWLGTQDGLNRYDGKNFLSFQYKIDDSTSLSNNYVKDIVEDNDKNLWIGTYGGGLNKFDKKSNFEHFLQDSENPNSISNNVVYSILQYSDSVYWLGTKNGLNKFNIKTEKFSNQISNPENFPSLNNPVVYCISKAEDANEIWVGTREGLHKVNTETYQVEKFLKGENGLKDDDIRDLYFDTNGILWIATKLGGVFYKKSNSNNFEQIDLKFVDENKVYARKIYPNNKGGIWLGTFDKGLFYINDEFKTIHQFQEEKYNPNALPSSNVVEIYQDESGNYWLGTHGGGISSFNLNQKKFDLYQPDEDDPYSISDDAVNYIFEDSRGDIYIANDAGIDIVLENNEQLQFKQVLSSYSGFPDDRGWLLFEDSDNILWVGLWNFGLSKYNRDTGELKSYRNIEEDTNSITTNFIESIAEAPNGKLWIGLLGDGGLVVFDKDKENFKRYRHDVNDPSSLSNNRVHKVLIDHKNRIWLGTDFGLDLYRPTTDDFKHFRYDKNDSSSINYNIIRTIIEDSNNNIWIGTGGGGITKLIETKAGIQFKSFTEDDGLVNNNIAGITEDLNGNLWISTYKGISSFNPKTEEFKNYDSSDGLQGEEFVRRSITTLKDGRIFAGGYNGLNVFKPEDLKRSEYEPSVNIVSVEITSENGANQIRDFSIDSILLDHNDYLLSFEIATTDLSNSDKIEYAYLLEGFNKEWIYNKNRRHFTFTNLPPGEYNLKIKGTNSDGKWSGNIKELYINVDPPFWATPWFRTLFVVFLIILVLAYIQLRIRYLKKSRRTLQAKVEERTSELEITNKHLLENQSLVLHQKEEIAQKNAIIQKQNDELKLSNLQLEEMVDERTKELRETNDNLKIAKHEFDTFFYRAAHDLKGPVSTILGLCYLAMKETDEEAAVFYFTKVNETADRMNNILFNLQKINKLKQQEVVVQNHNIRKLIIDAAKENIPDNEDWQQFINIELKALDENILTDSVHLKVIFSNLINNSIKFSKRAEKPNVVIEFSKNEKDKTYQIVFEDFGLGIDPHFRDKIFNMFFVATEHKRGNGLGLYSVRLAVSKLGGEIYLEEDKSACFRIELPIPYRKELMVN